MNFTVLDMESEFYKLAMDILAKPRNFHKLFAVGPESGRLTLMGADGGVVIGHGVLREMANGPRKRAYRIGENIALDLFGGLVEEFDEEVRDLPSKKLMKLALGLAHSTGWGEFGLKKMSGGKGKIVIEGRRTIELGMKNPSHHMLTLGYVAGLCTVAMRKKMTGDVQSVDGKRVVFSFRPASHGENN
ncbi:MAG: hypothetical protein P8Y09_09625 [Deltaproteobacteria bacterium]